MPKTKKCPKCGRKLRYCKPQALKNGNVMPAFYGHFYSFGEVIDSMNICSYSERVND